MDEQRTIAYFSVEIGLDPEMPTYSGGLGIGVTGWSIGEEGSSDWSKDAVSLYSRLEQTIIPMFYHERDRLSGNCATKLRDR